MRSRSALAGIVAGAAALLAAAPAASAVSGPATRLCDDLPAVISESSGVDVGAANGVVWTHNDSGDVGRFFAVRLADCSLAGEWRLEDASGQALAVTDVEDLTQGPDGHGGSTLWLGDLGDNLMQRTGVRLYEVAEPQQAEVDAGGVHHLPPGTWSAHDLVYADGLATTPRRCSRTRSTGTSTSPPRPTPARPPSTPPTSPPARSPRSPSSPSRRPVARAAPPDRSPPTR